MRSWTHNRKFENLSLEQLQENGTYIDGDVLYDIPDPEAEPETMVLDKMKIEDFKRRLSETDMKILELRAAVYSQKESADTIGYRTTSAVSKRIERIAEQYEEFVGREYGEFLDKNVKKNP